MTRIYARGAACISLALVAILLIVSALPAATAQTGRILLDSPVAGTRFLTGQTISVTGSVLENDGTPLGGVDLAVRLTDVQGIVVLGTFDSGFSAQDGRFLFSIDIPRSLSGGAYRLVASSSNAPIAGEQIELLIGVPFSGVSPWVWAAVIGATAGGVIGVLALLRAIGRRRRVATAPVSPDTSRRAP